MAQQTRATKTYQANATRSSRRRGARATAAPAPGQRTAARPGITTSVVTAFCAAVLTFVLPSLAWLWWLVTALIVAWAVLSGPIRRGRREAAGERERRAGIAEADRYRRLSSLDTMTGNDFERHVANLCLRDGLEIVQSGGGAGDLGADVIANLPDGRRVVIQCKRYTASRSVSGPEMQRFLGTVRAEHGADVALFVTTARRFTRQATDLAGRHQVCLIQRDRLGFWNNGTPLPSLLSSWEHRQATGAGGR